MKHVMFSLSTLALASSCLVTTGCLSTEDDGSGAPGASSEPLARGTLSVAVTPQKINYMLQQDNGDFVRLNLDNLKSTTWGGSELPINWRTASGSPVEVFGKRSADGSISVEEMQPPSGVVESHSALVTTGGRHILALRMGFDGRGPDGTEQDIKNTMNDVVKFFDQNSFGKLHLTYDVSPVVNVRFGTCDDYDRWVNEAKAGARNAGVDLGRYQQFMLFGKIDCGYGGMGMQPGDVTWITSPKWPGVIDHELGHNYDNWHSASNICHENGQIVSMSNDCSFEEYGDPYDSMGHGLGQHYNANYKAKLGWIPASNIVDATGDQTYTLTPETAPSSGVQLIRVKGPGDILYTVDFRQPVDTSELPLPANHPSVNSVMIHAFYTSAQDSNRARLLDMNPGGNFDDAGLGVGRSYKFFGTSTTITVLSASPAGAQVKIIGAGGSGDTGSTGNRVVVVRSNKCIGVLGAGRNNGDPAVQFPCNGAADQTWAFESVGGSTVVLKDANTGKCMDVLGVSRDNGAKVVQWDCTGGANQKWDVVDAGNGAFSLRSVNSGKCLDVSGGNTGDNVPMVQWDCHGGTNQQFRKQ